MNKTAVFEIKKVCLLLVLMFGTAINCHGRFSMEYIGKRTKLFYNGTPISFLQCVNQQLQRYPESRIQDIVLFARQAANGSTGISTDKKQAWKAFQKEFSSTVPADIPLIEIISPDFCRINFGAWKKAGLPAKWLFNMWYASMTMGPQDLEIFKGYISLLKRVPGIKHTELLEYIKNTQDDLKNHSAHYIKKYRPAYCVISTRFLTAFPVLKAASKLPERPVKVIAVDGKAASGKTTLAKYLALILETDAVHMDDFFLPMELRSKARLSEPGGNVQYERFMTEVLPFLHQKKAFSYRRFDCSEMQIGATQNISISSWRIVEGAYSLHPKFGNYADLKVFFNISPEEQIARIRKRNGERKAKDFISRWIPMEEKYISAFNIKKQANIILGN